MSTFKRYLMFQAMMFVFGIVGPIFLIMFFTTQPDPTVKWAYWWGLFITAADVLIALWLTARVTEWMRKGPKDARIAAELAGSHAGRATIARRRATSTACRPTAS